MLMFNFGHQQLQQWQWRDDDTFWTWQYEELPVILDTQTIVPLKMMSHQSKWPPSKSFDWVVVYQKTNTIKAIRIYAEVKKGEFTFPSAEEIRILDADAPNIPMPPNTRTNKVQTDYGNILLYGLHTITTNLNWLTIRNRSGQDLKKMTVVRGDGPTLTMKDLLDSSTRKTIITQEEEAQLIKLRGYLANGSIFETNFTVVVSAERKKNVDVKIDENLKFHVTEKNK